MSRRDGRELCIAVLARSVYPLHRYGGLERHVFDLVRCLTDRGVHVTLITPPAAAARPDDRAADAALQRDRVSMLPVPYTTFPFANRRGTTVLDRSTAYPLFGWRAGQAAARLVLGGQVDIVHGLGASALGYAAAVPAVRARAPLVLNPQGMEEFGATDPSRAPLKRLGYLPLRMAVRRCARSAARVIATDRSLVDPVLAHLRVPREIVRVIPNAIEPDDGDTAGARSRASALRGSLGLTGDDVLVVSVGRLESNKGFDVMVDALARLSAGRRLTGNWKWVLVGDGPRRALLQRDVAAAGLAAHVVLAGRAPGADLHGWYEAATLFVHPTLYEGSSLVTLEAMAHRRAVVASRAGGLPDKVVPGVTGWLVPPGDAAALADALAAALADRPRLSSMGAAGRTLVERRFSWRAATDRLLDIASCSQNTNTP
jgi:glycosyltransferase involved in cell wall biosynthesis